jgi:hypothetical protein
LRSPFLIILVWVLSAAAAPAQVNPKPSPTPKTDEQEPVRVFTEEVRLPVAATDAYGHSDPAIEIDNVLVLDDGETEEIRSI